jgi:hypothetical protein
MSSFHRGRMETLPCGWYFSKFSSFPSHLFDSPRGLGTFIFIIASRKALGPTQPPIQWAPGTLSLGVKRPGSEADQSPLSNAEIKEWVELYLHSPNTPSWRGAWLKQRDNWGHRTHHSNSKFLYCFCYTCHGLSPLICSVFVLTSETVNPCRCLIGLLGRGIGPPQGLYLHTTIQHKRNTGIIHSSIGLRTHV